MKRKLKHDYVVQYETEKEPMAYREGRYMARYAVAFIVVLCVLSSCNFS